MEERKEPTTRADAEVEGHRVTRISSSDEPAASPSDEPAEVEAHRMIRGTDPSREADGRDRKINH